MNKLILATGMIGLALVTTQAQAGEKHAVVPATNLRSTQPQTKPKLGHDTHELRSWNFSFNKI